MRNRIVKNNKGVTLIELMVSVALFAITIVAVTQIFITLLNGQKNAIAARNLQENIRFAFEVMAKELRMARIDDGICSEIDNNKVYDNDAGYNESAVYLKFKNYHNECVKYYLEDDRIKIDRDGVSGFMTPDEIKVSNLKFLVKDANGGSGANSREQSIVTLRMDIEAINTKAIYAQEMQIQTSISSRYY
ncbi:prepilin-type N-terminal cleavage/methylation domain-containing protein [Patescibacteria group bacterium]|nr:prepilin-type N-terminal cleavage/methylation domain-containing protein [Patescibacteria group bacterium]